MGSSDNKVLSRDAMPCREWGTCLGYRQVLRYRPLQAVAAVWACVLAWKHRLRSRTGVPRVDRMGACSISLWVMPNIMVVLALLCHARRGSERC